MLFAQPICARCGKECPTDWRLVFSDKYTAHQLCHECGVEWQKLTLEFIDKPL